MSVRICTYRQRLCLPLLIDRSVMQKACGDEKTAKWLEENLAIMPDVILLVHTRMRGI